MKYRQKSCETVLPQALSDHQTHDSGTLAQILGHKAPPEVVHSALGHHMQLYRSQQARWMGAVEAAGSDHSVNPAQTHTHTHNSLHDKLQTNSTVTRFNTTETKAHHR
jgi:hypothetical protein